MDKPNKSKLPVDSATIKSVVTQLISILSSRNRDVISRRFGLKTGKKETLESIGQTYGITRERVRQIEEASLKLIRESLDSGEKIKIQPYIAHAAALIEKSGGVMRENRLFAEFSGIEKESPLNAALVFVLTLENGLVRTLEDDDFHTFWSLSDDHAKNFKNSVASFIKSLETKKEVIAQPVIADLESLISISKNIDRNVFGEVGLSRWPDIMPRGVRDKSFLVLKKEGKPKHFREITQLINEAGFSDRKAHVQTVHNELIKDPRFVLVGRGIYGLSEWGFKAGTVKDIMVDLLNTSGKPMSKKEIVARVLSHRMVKENTIILNLQDSKTFAKSPDGNYTIRQA